MPTPQHRRTALVLGTRAHADFFEVCLALGLDIIACDVDREALGLLDKRIRPIQVDIVLNTEMVLAALLQEELDLEAIDLILTVDELCTPTAAVLAQLAGVPGLAVGAALATRNKLVLKEQVARRGLPVAEVVAQGRYESILEQVEEGDAADGPWVLKPVAGVASMYTFRVEDLDELRAVGAKIAESIAASHADYILEQFVRFDRELHVDGVVADGELQFVSIGEYSSPCLDITNGDLNQTRLIEPLEEPELFGAATELAAGVLAAIGHDRGVFHLEAFSAADGTLTFGECACRPGGGAVVPMIEARFGINLYRALIDVMSRGTTSALEPDASNTTNGQVAYTPLPGLGGTVVSCPSDAELLALPAVVGGGIRISPGDPMKDMRAANFDTSGYAIVRADDATGLRLACDSVVEWFGRNTVVCGTGDRPESSLWDLAGLEGLGFASARSGWTA